MKSFTFRDAYVPSADRLRERSEGGGFAWFEPSRAVARAVRPMLKRLAAHPASRLRGLDAGALQAPVAEQVDAVPHRAPVVPATADASTPWGWIVRLRCAGRRARGARAAPTLPATRLMGYVSSSRPNADPGLPLACRAGA